MTVEAVSASVSHFETEMARINAALHEHARSLRELIAQSWNSLTPAKRRRISKRMIREAIYERRYALK